MPRFAGVPIEQKKPRFGGVPVEGVGAAEDIARSGASGLRQGLESTAGAVGDVGNLNSRVAEWAAEKLGGGENVQSGVGFLAKLLGGPASMVSSEDVRKLTDPIFGEAYKPQTTEGEYARTVGQFAPAAAMGPGGIIRRVLTQAIAPAVASETGGQLTKGTAAEPYARIAGALAGGIGASSAANAVTGAKAALPTAAEIKSSAGYSALKEPMRAAQLTPEAYQGIVRGLAAEARDFGLTTKLKGEFGGVLTDFAKRAQASGGASLYDLELLRRSLRNAGGDKLDEASQALSGKLIDHLDDAVESLSESSIRAGGETGTPILDVLKDARQTYSTGMKSQMVETAVERARNAASGFENGLRVEFRKLLNNPKNAKRFSDVERQAMQGVVRGTLKSNALRWLGGFGVPLDNGRNFLGSVIGGGAGASIGSLAGPVGTAVGGPLLVGLGTAAKAGANAATRNQALIAEALVKAGPSASRVFGEALSEASRAKTDSVLRALLQSSLATGGVPMPRQINSLGQ